MKRKIIVHRNPASPFPMYFYALEECNNPEDEDFPGHPGLWYGLYVLPDFLAIQVPNGWQHLCPIVTNCGRRFVVDVGMPMYVCLNEQNTIETFAISSHDRESIHTCQMIFLLGGNDVYHPSDEEVSFLNHPEYHAAFTLTKRAQSLDY